MLPVKKSLIALTVFGLVGFGGCRKEKTFSVGDIIPDFGKIPNEISLIDVNGDKIIDYTLIPYNCNGEKRLFGFYDWKTGKLHLSEKLDRRISFIFPYDGQRKLSDYVPVCS